MPSDSPPTAPDSRLFNLDGLARRIPAPVAKIVRAPLEALLCFKRLNALYEWATASTAGPAEDHATALRFSQNVLDRFRMDIRVSKSDLDRIPKTGPLIVVANHPYGAIEGMVLISVISQVREDFKVMANHLLGHVPEMRPLFIFVDVFETEESTLANVKGLKETLRWLKDGQALGVFPAGEVSHLDLRKRRISERDWSVHVATLARRTGATVLPVRFGGTNSPTFHLAGLIHPRLRTVLLPREVFNKQRKRMRMRIGTAIRPDRIAAFFHREVAGKTEVGHRVHDVPPDYLRRPRLPRCSGVAMGVDRLVMAVLGSRDIDEVIAFRPDFRYDTASKTDDTKGTPES